MDMDITITLILGTGVGRDGRLVVGMKEGFGRR